MTIKLKISYGAAKAAPLQNIFDKLSCDFSDPGQQANPVALQYAWQQQAR
jgi:hypothetical protein